MIPLSDEFKSAIGASDGRQASPCPLPSPSNDAEAKRTQHGPYRDAEGLGNRIGIDIDVIKLMSVALAESLTPLHFRYVEEQGIKVELLKAKRGRLECLNRGAATS